MPTTSTSKKQEKKPQTTNPRQKVHQLNSIALSVVATKAGMYYSDHYQWNYLSVPGLRPLTPTHSLFI